MVYNTGETSEELKEKYNPEGSLLRKAQLRMLDMLMYLDKVCKEIGVEYRLDGGNVLGAVRHGGFIPWDDDVDVVVSYKDCKKLKKHLLAHPHPQYVLQCAETDPGYYGSWIVLRDLKSEYIQQSETHQRRKFKGFQVDIFPFETGIIKPLFWIAQRIQWNNEGKISNKHPRIARILFYFQYNFLYPVFRLIGLFLGNKKIYMHSYGHGHNCSFPTNIIDPLKPIDFEGITIPGPAKPDEFCKILYKNFMDLPPVNKRDHHEANYKIWD